MGFCAYDTPRARGIRNLHLVNWSCHGYDLELASAFTFRGGRALSAMGAYTGQRYTAVCKDLCVYSIA